MKRKARKTRGFTMLELLVALTLLVTAFTIIFTTFFTTVTAWERGEELLEDLHHGDFVMEQLVAALRSTAYFESSPGVYGFWLDAGGGSYPKDEISWVTSGTAFLPPDSPLANGLYRLNVTIEDNDDGDPSVAVQAYAHMADPDDIDPETWYVSSKVRGLECLVYDFDEENWDSEWEDTNSVPALVQLTLFMEPLEKYGKPVELRRLVEIQVAAAVGEEAAVTAPVNDQGGTEQETPAQGTQNQGTQNQGTPNQGGASQQRQAPAGGTGNAPRGTPDT